MITKSDGDSQERGAQMKSGKAKTKHPQHRDTQNPQFKFSQHFHLFIPQIGVETIITINSQTKCVYP